jgi:ribosomal protein L11 methyltransferase
MRLRAFFEFAPDTSGWRAYHPHLELEPDVDWSRAALDAWPPLEVGASWFLAPPWNDAPTPPGRRRLTIHPGMALGTGAHPCTQLCLVAMEEYLLPGDIALDLGTGSGLLAAAARLLGARCSIGCDIDQGSVSIARENLIADEVPPDVFAGSTRALASQSVDLLIANINSVTHLALAGEYRRLTRRTLVLSGFPTSESARVAAALAGAGFAAADSFESSDWACTVFTLPERAA